MENLKIKVNNQAESREAQELFFELEFKWADEVMYYMDIGKNKYITSFVSLGRLGMGDGGCDVEEITLPQLRNKVVLHRNDVRDATHKSEVGRKGYLSNDGVEYYFNFDRSVWSKLESNTFKSFNMVEINKSKNEINVENLISGKDVYQALADGKEVEVYYGTSWRDVFGITIHTINTGEHKFRIKPQTIKIGSIDVPAPFKPEIGYGFYYISASCVNGYSWRTMHDDTSEFLIGLGAWRTEDEIKQVVAVLHNIFNDQLHKDE